MQQTIILFDINETVLNLSVLKPKFKALFGDEHYTDTWFSMLLHASTVSMMTGVNTNFASLSKIMLETLAARTGVTLSRAEVDDVLSGFSSLPAHSDIKAALTTLRSAGFRVVALSNSSLNLIHSQIHNAGLDEYFDEIISVEEAGTFKPSQAAYEFAATKLAHPKDKLRLVATHDWDTHGAMSAGLQAAYINRSGAPYNPLYKRPAIYADSMSDLVDQIIASDD
ncbi:haloacid dehalogenase type II [Amphritea sp. 1_MG-2023]|uniref:haloacid dehalogenase type II n=1 Tax=Amphritea sp. 1_MG-2023 TaxID=3062670 RepID=UPI0026E37D35|nr:haloacid dehalogenase type II [Amphritea sp. 1_MG-2023]MDO6563119.1 haloacid dehalogenase type II [Amphritea sp. 1_MG-2023]